MASARRVPFLSLYVQGSNAGAYFTSQIAHLLLFLLLLVVNTSLGSIRRSWVLQRGELVVIFIMTSLANSVPGLISYWVPLVSSPFYYAQPREQLGRTGPALYPHLGGAPRYRGHSRFL